MIPITLSPIQLPIIHIDQSLNPKKELYNPNINYKKDYFNTLLLSYHKKFCNDIKINILNFFQKYEIGFPVFTKIPENPKYKDNRIECLLQVLVELDFKSKYLKLDKILLDIKNNPNNKKLDINNFDFDFNIISKHFITKQRIGFYNIFNIITNLNKINCYNLSNETIFTLHNKELDFYFFPGFDKIEFDNPIYIPEYFDEKHIYVLTVMNIRREYTEENLIIKEILFDLTGIKHQIKIVLLFDKILSKFTFIVNKNNKYYWFTGDEKIYIVNFDLILSYKEYIHGIIYERE